MTTDVSLTGWGAVKEGGSSWGLWREHHIFWHINCLEMLAVLPPVSKRPSCSSLKRQYVVGLIHKSLGRDAMAQTWPRLCLYAFPAIALLPGVLDRVCQEGVSLLLVAPFWPARVWFSNLIVHLDGTHGRFPSGGTFYRRPGDNIPPSARVMKTVGLAPEGDQFINAALSTEVVETILNSTAPSTTIYIL